MVWESCYTYQMTHQDFIDNAIITLAAAAPDGTTWADVVRDAHELAAARLAVSKPLDKVRPAGGRLSPEERARRHQEACAAVLGMLDAAPGNRIAGGLYAVASLAPCGRNAAVTACRVLEDRGLIRFGVDASGRKSVTLAPRLQGDEA
jgi:hypothetical protein